jgi:amino-acid N-acetyltransferase
LASEFVNWFRSSARYIRAHRGNTFVLLFGGEAAADPSFPSLIHDIALLNSLGVHLVLVHGARPQIEQRLRERNAALRYVGGLRITDDAALTCVKEAAGFVRVEIEALLSMGIANSPMEGAGIRVASGNFVTARPLGVRDGTDYCHTGEVRRIDRNGIDERLASGSVVLLPPLGYSPTGEVFNLSAEDVARSTAVALGADKLICLLEGSGLLDEQGRLIPQVTTSEAESMLRSGAPLPSEVARLLEAAVLACRNGVRRTHLISRSRDGGLLLELYSRDGCGTLVASEQFESVRAAGIEDVGGILELLEPIEAEGILVRRSRELLETEIDRFTVVERDGMVVSCAALYPFPEERVGELACLAVHPQYRGARRGQDLLKHLEEQAKSQNLEEIFVLTTRAAQWFQERGFHARCIAELPVKRQLTYNLQRNSKMYVKELH